MAAVCGVPVEVGRALPACVGVLEEVAVLSRRGEGPATARVVGACGRVVGELFRDTERLDLRGGAWTGVADFGSTAFGLGN